VLESLLTLLRPNRVSLVLDEAERELTQRSHERIYQFILDGAVEESRREMREHTQHGQRILLALPANGTRK
jgi:DNA-binding FadR family transcriptional regulator